MNSYYRAGATGKPLFLILAGLMIAAPTFAELPRFQRSGFVLISPASPQRSEYRSASLRNTRAAGTRPDVAATVDGRTITASRVRELAFRSAGSAVLDQLIGNILIDQEARKRHIVVTTAEVRARVDNISKLMKPNELEVSLHARHMSLREMSEQIRVQMEVEKLIGPTLPPVMMSHIADIYISNRPSIPDGAPGHQTHSAAQAKSIVDELRQRLQAGASFSELAKHYSDDPATKDRGGDLGIVTNVSNTVVAPAANLLGTLPGTMKTALKLKRGEARIVPVMPKGGFHIIKALSTGADHDTVENVLYANAQSASREAQFGIQAPDFVQFLRRKGRVIVYRGKHIVGRTAVAAMVNGRVIQLARVKDLAYRMAGASVLRHMIDVILVDQEANRQKIVVTSAEVEAKISTLRQSMGPASFESMLRERHMSMGEFRESVRTELASHLLVWKSMGAPKPIHVCHIFILTNADAISNFPGAKPRSDSEARTLLAHIQAELRTGKKFTDLARAYSDDTASKARGGDLGVIQPETQFSGAIYQAASILKRGEITPTPVASVDGLHLIMAVSTYEDHPPAENGLYSRTIDHIHARELQVFLRPYLQHLRAKSKVEVSPRYANHSAIWDGSSSNGSMQ